MELYMIFRIILLPQATRNREDMKNYVSKSNFLAPLNNEVDKNSKIY